MERGDFSGPEVEYFDWESAPFFEDIRTATDADARFRTANALLAFVEEKWSTRCDAWRVSACAEVSYMLSDLHFRSAAWLWLERIFNSSDPPIRDSETFQYVCLVPIIEAPITWTELARLLACGSNDNAARCILAAYRIADLEERVHADLIQAYDGDPRLLRELQDIFRNAS